MHARGFVFRKVLVGPWATNPVTRYPSVTAGAAATLAVLTGGRDYVGIGPGDAAVYNIGHKPAKLFRLEEYIYAVRRLLGDREADWGGKLARLDYPHPPPSRLPCPLLVLRPPGSLAR